MTLYAPQRHVRRASECLDCFDNAVVHDDHEARS
jgi:hypothetical protein